jgi:hypothetical protein
MKSQELKFDIVVLQISIIRLYTVSSYVLFTAKFRIHLPDTRQEICVGQCGIITYFSSNIPVFPWQ